MIELRDLTKSFRTVHGRHFVFRDLSLTFPDGANIGLIGPNGAGKSTLMRVIGGIDAPDSGSVVTNRRISFPVGLSGGFQGTLSGRDNAKFVCRLYGVTPQEVRDKVSFVEEFAELGKYFDMPIKTYSSGMRSRLIFGLSMAFDFDYYLMDEVGAVGDAGFKEKSRELLESKIGTANVICVSHNMSVIREQCDVLVLLQGGEAVLYADREEGIRAYQGDAYVPPAVVRRRKPKPLSIETITPRDIRRARRVLRVVRRARQELIATSPTPQDNRGAQTVTAADMPAGPEMPTEVSGREEPGTLVGTACHLARPASGVTNALEGTERGSPLQDSPGRAARKLEVHAVAGDGAADGTDSGQSDREVRDRPEPGELIAPCDAVKITAACNKRASRRRPRTKRGAVSGHRPSTAADPKAPGASVRELPAGMEVRIE